MGDDRSPRPGAKERDYWWTVIATDPLAIPLTRFLLRRGRLTPDRVSGIASVLGACVGLAFAFGTRASLAAGALLFHAAFLFDCVDGKLARALHSTSARGHALDRLADGSRRASASLGLALWLWRADSVPDRDVWWAVVFGVMYGFYVEIAGVDKLPDSALVRRWSAALGRHRLVPHPGTPDLEALVFVIGPLTGLIVPALAAGIAATGFAIAVSIARLVWARSLDEDTAQSVLKRSWGSEDGSA